MRQDYAFGKGYSLLEYAAAVTGTNFHTGNFQSGNLGFWSERIVLHLLRTESGDALDTSKKHTAVLQTEMCPGIELIARQSVLKSIVAEMSGKRIETAEPSVRAYPKPSETVLLHSADYVGRQSVFRGKGGEFIFGRPPAVESVACTYPHEFGRSLT